MVVGEEIEGCVCSDAIVVEVGIGVDVVPIGVGVLR